MSTIEFTIDKYAKLWMDQTHITGFSNNFSIHAAPNWTNASLGDATCNPSAKPGPQFAFGWHPNYDVGGDPMVSNPLYVGYNPTFDCNNFKIANLNFSDTDCLANPFALAQCPAQLATTACGQHACRVHMHTAMAKPDSWCAWLRHSGFTCDGYCWSMDEKECTGSDCGYGARTDQPTANNKQDCIQLELAMQDDMKNNKLTAERTPVYSCGDTTPGQGVTDGAGGLWWTNPTSSCVDNTQVNPLRVANIRDLDKVTVLIDRPGWTPTPPPQNFPGICSPPRFPTYGCASCSCCGGGGHPGNFPTWSCPGSSATCPPCQQVDPPKYA